MVTRTPGIWQLSVVAAVAVSLAACRSQDQASASAPSTTVASFRLAPLANPDGPVTEVIPARDAAQVALLLVGDPMPVDDLTAELGQMGALDDARRWPVDPPAPGDAGVSGRVVVPNYAVPAGNHLLTLWRGDAEVVARYRIRVP